MTDLASHFACSLNAVSKHVKVLEQAGLVMRRRAGREHWLTFRPGPLGEAAGWIDSRRTFWSVGLERWENLLAS